MLEREILYRLLQGPQGGVLRQIARDDSRLSQVREAIAWIRAHFDESIRIEDLAERAGMSPVSFHRHFKSFPDRATIAQPPFDGMSDRELMNPGDR